VGYNQHHNHKRVSLALMPKPMVVRTEQLSRELRLALRRLLAAPLFSAFAILSIALGLGVTTAVYSTISGLVWNTSSFEDADRIAVITQLTSDRNRSWRWQISKADFDALQDRLRSRLALSGSSPVSGILNDGAQTSVFLGQAVTGNFFSMVGLPMALGRGIQESDDRPDADPVVVLSHEFWQTKTGGDPNLVGRTVRIDERPFVVIGVVAGSFKNGRYLDGQFGIANGDAWIPFAARTPPATPSDPPATPSADKSAPAASPTSSTQSPTITPSTGKSAGNSAPTQPPQPTPTPPPAKEPGLTVLVRPPTGRTIASIAAEVASVSAALDRSTPLSNASADGRLVTRSWSAVSASEITRAQADAAVKAGGAIVLLVGLVLVVACTNIANLTLGRGAWRQHEFSVRRALGASRGRLIREQCMESLIVALFGGAGALLIAQSLVRAVTTDIPQGNGTVTAVRPELNTPALIAAGGSLLVSLVVFGLIPAIQLTRTTLRDRLAGDAVGATPSRWRGRGWLIAGQVAISTAFLLVAFASVRAVNAVARQDPGFDLSHLAVASINFRPRHWDTTRTQQAIASIDTVARTASGFTSIAFTMGLPLGEGPRLRQLARVSIPDDSTAQPRELPVRALPSTPSIFRTLGVPILRGRGFDDHDIATTPQVIVISAEVAREMFGVVDAVGRQLRYLGPVDDTPRLSEIVGVAQDVNSRVFDLKLGTVYVPLAQEDVQRVLIVGRTVRDPGLTVRNFAKIVRLADPDLAVEFAATGPMVMTPTYIVLRLAGLLSGSLAILAVTLAMVGLYGVLSHVVARRTREIGVRLALGAETNRVRRMIVAEGLRPVLWGLGLGQFVGIGARALLRATDVAHSISPVDPTAIAVSATTLLVAGLVATYFPARHASKVDPNDALRSL
jgi:predicted permease